MGYVEMAFFPSKYNENLEIKFYVNLFDSGDDSTNPASGAVYVKGTPIAVTQIKIPSFMSCPHYEEIKGTGLEGDVD